MGVSVTQTRISNAYNGGSVGNVGKSIQDAIDGMKGKGHAIKKENVTQESKD